MEVKLPINCETDQLRTVISQAAEDGTTIILHDLESDNYQESWDDLIRIGHNLTLVDQTVTIYSNHSATLRYLDLLNIPYKMEFKPGTLMKDLPLIVNLNSARTAFRYYFNNCMFEHLRIMLESGYVPEVKELSELLREVTEDNIHHYIFTWTLPLPWTDELYYREAIRMVRPRGYLLGLLQYYCVFYDPTYRPFWDGIRRYINSHPNHRLPEFMVNYALDGELSDEVKRAYKLMATEDDYPITNYNILLIRDMSNYDRSAMEFFVELASYSNYLAFDSRFANYWQELCENPNLLDEVIGNNSLSLQYLDYKNLHNGYDSTCDKHKWKLLELIKSGDIHVDSLADDHPLRVMWIGSQTKSSRYTLSN